MQVAVIGLRPSYRGDANGFAASDAPRPMVCIAPGSLWSDPRRWGLALDKCIP